MNTSTIFVTRNSNGFYGTDENETILTPFFAERADAEDAVIDLICDARDTEDFFDTTVTINAMVIGDANVMPHDRFEEEHAVAEMANWYYDGMPLREVLTCHAEWLGYDDTILDVIKAFKPASERDAFKLVAQQLYKQILATHVPDVTPPVQYTVIEHPDGFVAIDVHGSILTDFYMTHAYAQSALDDLLTPRQSTDYDPSYCESDWMEDPTFDLE